MPRRSFCACTKYAPWLGVPTAIWMSAVRTPWVRSGNAVTAQWGLLERHEDAVRTQRGRIYDRHKNATVCSGVCTETPRSVWRRHCVSTASSRRVYGVCTAPKPNIIYSIAPSRRTHRAAAAIIAIPWRHHGVLRRLQGVCRAFARRWHSDHSSQLRLTKENGTQATFMNV